MPLALHHAAEVVDALLHAGLEIRLHVAGKRLARWSRIALSA